MMWWYPGMAQVGWGMMAVNGLATLVFLAGLAVLIAWAVRSFSARPPAREEPLEILQRRFAAGEISQAEFEQARRALRS
jgi:putative membrane protein